MGLLPFIRRLVSLPDPALDVPDFPFPEWERYESLGFLGEGCFGLVFKVRDRDLDRLAALKFLHATDPARVTALKGEARAQAQLDHPHFCRVYEVGQQGDRPYIAMQFVDGRPLEEVARDMDLATFVALLAELAEAVDHGHRSGLAHRDLKANNVLVERSPDGAYRPCIVDFGLAVHGLDPQEAYRGDLWSLGEMAYTLLGGFPSSAGPSSLLRGSALPPAPRPSLHALDPGFPRPLSDLLQRCLSLEPSDSYAHAADFARDLRGWLASRSSEAPRPKAAPTFRWASAALALALAAGLAATLRPGHPPAATDPMRAELETLRSAIQRDTDRLSRLEARLLEARSAEERRNLMADIEAMKASLERHRARLALLEGRMGPAPAASRPREPSATSLPEPRPVRGESERAPEGMVPATLVHQVIPAYPSDRLGAAVSTPDPLEVTVDVRVDAEGRPAQALVPGDVPEAFRVRAMEAALASRYAPARAGKAPVESWMRVTYRFSRAQSLPADAAGSPPTDQPLRVLRLVPLAITQEQYDRMTAGGDRAPLSVLVRIDAQGRPEEIKAQRALPADVEVALGEAVRRSRFAPGIQAGQAREGWITLSFPLR